MSRTFIFERFDLFGDRTPAADGEFVRAQDAIDREAVLQSQIRTLETQLKDARATVVADTALDRLTAEQERLGLYDDAERASEGQEPVAIYHGNGIIDCGDAGHHNIELLKMIPAGAKLYKDPSGEIAVLREAMKGAEVIANAAGAEIAALRELLSELAALRRYDPNNGKRKDPYRARNLTLNVPAELFERIDAATAREPE